MDTETETAADVLLSVFTSMFDAESRIVQNVQQFVSDVVVAPDSVTERMELFEYIVGMILFLWQQRKDNLDSILRGLQKQSLTSLHSFLCPDLLSHTNPTETSNLDPYKDTTKELQRLSDIKPRPCQFCHKESIFTYVSAQTRSADEGMTTFVTCSLCGKRQKL